MNDTSLPPVMDFGRRFRLRKDQKQSRAQSALIAGDRDKDKIGNRLEGYSHWYTVARIVRLLAFCVVKAQSSVKSEAEATFLARCRRGLFGGSWGTGVQVGKAMT